MPLIGGGVFTAILIYISASQSFLDPGFGPVVLAIISAGIAYGMRAVIAALSNACFQRPGPRPASVCAVVSRCRPCSTATPIERLWLTFVLAIVTIIVGVAVGYAFGGFDKGLSALLAASHRVPSRSSIFVDRAMQSWAEYSDELRSSAAARSRRSATASRGLEGSFWVIANDTFSHLILPTLALMLISVATYTRYSRASMLEVLNQDYIRTARAKGLTERTVIVRHGFRNAMIPLATVVAVGHRCASSAGRSVTETVFEWNAMGRMFTRRVARRSTRIL